jgi:hypothetical protein
MPSDETTEQVLQVLHEKVLGIAAGFDAKLRALLINGDVSSVLHEASLRLRDGSLVTVAIEARVEPGDEPHG